MFQNKNRFAACEKSKKKALKIVLFAALFVRLQL
jgi:hypothetical protein